MKIRTERPFFYSCTIYRGNAKITRQGCINAEDELEAIDRVYEMARVVWNRQCTEVTIMDPHNGEVLGHSTIAQKIREAKGTKGGAKGAQTVLHLPGPTKAAKKEEKEKKESGFVPWNQKREPEFYPSSVGTYFNPVRFNKLKGI